MTVSLDFLSIPATTAAPGLTLRTWRERDVPVIVAAYADPMVRRRSPLPLADDASVRAWFEQLNQDWAAGVLYVLAIVEGADADADALGLLALGRATPTSEVGDVTYWTVAERRGRAIAPRALEAVIGWIESPAWTDAPLRRLQLTHGGDNAAACRVAVKSGFEIERELAPKPPKYPLPGHLHARKL